MTDESCGTIYGYCDGVPTNIHQESSEDIQIVLADREECKRILKEDFIFIHSMNSINDNSIWSIFMGIYL